MHSIYFNPSLYPYMKNFIFVACHISLLLHADIFQSQSWPIQAELSSWLFFFHCNSPHKLTCLHRRFLSSVAALYRPIRPQGRFFALTQLTQAISSTQMFPFLFRSLHRSVRPHRYFFSSSMAHTGLLIHTDIFKFTQSSLCETSRDYSPFQVHTGLTSGGYSL